MAKWTVRQYVINALQNNLPTGITDARFKKPNAKFTTPNDSPWMRVVMSDSTTSDDDATGFYSESGGILAVDLFYPLGSMDKAGLDAGEEVRKLLSNKWIEELKISQGNISDAEEDTWYHVQITFNYTYEGQTNGS
jgi:hypothetical protein